MEGISDFWNVSEKVIKVFRIGLLLELFFKIFMCQLLNSFLVCNYFMVVFFIRRKERLLDTFGDWISL